MTTYGNVTSCVLSTPQNNPFGNLIISNPGTSPAGTITGVSCNDNCTKVIACYYGSAPKIYTSDSSGNWNNYEYNTGNLGSVGGGDCQCAMSGDGNVIVIAWYNKGQYYLRFDVSNSWVAFPNFEQNNTTSTYGVGINYNGSTVSFAKQNSLKVGISTYNSSTSTYSAAVEQGFTGGLYSTYALTRDGKRMAYGNKLGSKMYISDISSNGRFETTRYTSDNLSRNYACCAFSSDSNGGVLFATDSECNVFAAQWDTINYNYKSFFLIVSLGLVSYTNNINVTPNNIFFIPRTTASPYPKNVYTVTYATILLLLTDISFNLTQTKTVDINSTPRYRIPSISNCILWLDAADTGNIDLSGSIVTRWKDKSGLNNHMTGTTTTSLNYVTSGGTNTINNLNTLDFTAANAFLENTTISIPSTYTIFAVAYNKTTSGYSRLLSTYIDYSLFMGSLDNGYSTFVGNGGDTWNDYAVNNPIVNTNTPSLFGLTNGNTITSLLPYYNGTQLTSKNGVTRPFTGLLIGRYFGGFVQYWNGYVGEILIYSRVLSLSEQQQVEGYLSIKWGLYTQLPTSHPYYSPKYVGNLQVSINDANNSAANNLYYFYSVNSTPPTSNSYVLNTGPANSPYKFYVPVPTINNTIYIQAKNASGNTSNIANTTVIVYQQPRTPPIFNVSMVSSGGNIQVTVGESDPAPISYYYLNNISYVAYLYTGGTNQSVNLSYYTTNVGVLSNTNTTYGNVLSYISGLSANTYTVYLAAKNDFGNSLSTTISKTLIVYTTPGNVSGLSATTVAAGNLRVSITDTNNTAAVNSVYYFYSRDGTTFANSNILAGSTASPYSLFLNLPDISNTIFIKARNAVGDSATANINALLYQAPRNPPIFGVSLVGGGNLQVTVGELDSPSTVPNYYYLNNISYVAYLYTGGTNQSGNLSYYTTNVGVLSNTNTTYGNVLSYISGLSANTYTVYLAAINTVGNTISAGTNRTVSVYTTPGNVSLTATTVAAGNLQVSITDTNNTAAVNRVYYFYSTDGITFANSNILAGSTSSPYSLYLNLIDCSYTILVKANNSLGDSATANIQTLLYQAPRNPPIFGVSLVGGGNLQVTIGETNPSPTPNYYYLNNISYVAYLYTGGTNQSGNLSYYTYNVGTLTPTNTTYGNVVSYISGLSTNTYTVYLVARNTVGNTISSSANLTVRVLSLPSYSPVIDTGNTYVSGSGNLTITFTDSFNDPASGVSYSYYLYDATINQYILLQ